jgi:hypothetical protein
MRKYYIINVTEYLYNLKQIDKSGTSFSYKLNIIQFSLLRNIKIKSQCWY